MVLDTTKDLPGHSRPLTVGELCRVLSAMEDRIDILGIGWRVSGDDLRAVVKAAFAELDTPASECAGDAPLPDLLTESRNLNEDDSAWQVVWLKRECSSYQQTLREEYDKREAADAATLQALAERDMALAELAAAKAALGSPLNFVAERAAAIAAAKAEGAREQRRADMSWLLAQMKEIADEQKRRSFVYNSDAYRERADIVSLLVTSTIKRITSQPLVSGEGLS